MADVTLRYASAGLTGGTVGKLDAYSQAIFADGDLTIAVDAAKMYLYRWNASGTAAENSPLVIRPDDFDGTGLHELIGSPYGDLSVMPEIVSGLPIEGDIDGGDITRASNTTLTISPISCLDSGRTTKLFKATSTTFTVPHTGSIAANTIYHIFLVKLVADGSFEFRTYTTEAAVASDTAVSKYRWVGFWLTNGSSQLVQGIMVGNLFIFGKASEAVITGSLTTSFATYSHASLMPTSRIREIEYGISGGVDATAISSIDGTNTDAFLGGCYLAAGGYDDTGANAWCYAHYGSGGMLPFSTARQFKASSAGLDLLVHKIRIKR